VGLRSKRVSDKNIFLFFSLVKRTKGLWSADSFVHVIKASCDFFNKMLECNKLFIFDP
jgi:hypothetical protein